MSFSIPTLRAFSNKIGGIATLNAPVINMIGDCNGCGYSVSGTITADVGNKVAYKVTAYSDSSATVSCSDYDGITTGNIAYLDNIVASDHFSCVGRMPNGARILAVACNGSAFSNTTNEYLTAIACPASIDPPTINILSNTGGVVSYSVTSQYCNTTYIDDSNNMFCSPPSDPTNTSYKYSFTGSGTTSSTYTISCSPGANATIKAITYFDQNPSCTTRISSVASTSVTVN